MRRCSRILSKGFEAYIESARKAWGQLDNYMEVARGVKKIVERFWKDARVYVFGSVLEGKYTATSDIDILVVVNGVGREEVYRVKATVYRAIDAPIELHVTSSGEFERWYKRFIDKLEEIP